MKTTLLITTYNRPDALELVLRSVFFQSVLPDEVVVADDGSKQPTFDLIEKYTPKFPVPLIHSWQKDDGFRLARSRNLGIAKSSGDYLMMVDGDMILQENFVASHLKNAQKNQFIQGSRVLLSEKLTQKALFNKKITFSALQSGVRNRLNAINSPFLSSFFSKKKNTHVGVRGCNMAFWKEDLVKINGFNEDFKGWGREDSEFVVRLLNSGVQRKNLKFGGVAYHLYHPEESTKSTLTENDTILQKMIEEEADFCDCGLSQHL